MYNYIYVDPRKQGKYVYDGLNFCLLYEPYYVGLGRKRRKYDHLQPHMLEGTTNKLKSNKIKKLIKLGYNLRDYIITLNINSTKEEVKELEMQMVKVMGRLDLKTGSLTNLTDGGETTSEKLSLWASDRKEYFIQKYGESEGTKKYRTYIADNRNRMIGENNPTKRPEVRMLMSLSQKGNINKHKNMTLEEIIGRERASDLKEHFKKVRKNTQKGAKNHNAKTYKFIDDKGREYNIKGNKKRFLEEHNIQATQINNPNPRFYKHLPRWTMIEINNGKEIYKEHIFKHETPYKKVNTEETRKLLSTKQSKTYEFIEFKNDSYKIISITNLTNSFYPQYIQKIIRKLYVGEIKNSFDCYLKEYKYDYILYSLNHYKLENNMLVQL